MCQANLGNWIMAKQQIQINFNLFDSINELPKADQELLTKARQATTLAYAPYSKFQVGASGQLKSGAIISATNQENVSYGATVCAERCLLINHINNCSEDPIETIAISYAHARQSCDKPISPCGICRQALLEYETRFNTQLRFLLSGQSGSVLEIHGVRSLLPFAFESKDLEGR